LRRRSRQPLWLLRATLVQRVQTFVCLRACSALARRAERAHRAPPPSLLHRRTMAGAASSAPRSQRARLLRAPLARRVLPFSVQWACIALAHRAERAHQAPPPSSLHRRVTGACSFFVAAVGAC